MDRPLWEYNPHASSLRNYQNAILTCRHHIKQLTREMSRADISLWYEGHCERRREQLRAELAGYRRRAHKLQQIHDDHERRTMQIREDMFRKRDAECEGRQPDAAD